MERRLLDIENVTGVLLIRDRLELSAAFLIPHLLQLALAGGLKVTLGICTSCINASRMSLSTMFKYSVCLQVVLVLAQDSLSHYQQALRKLVSTNTLDLTFNSAHSICEHYAGDKPFKLYCPSAGCTC